MDFIKTVEKRELRPETISVMICQLNSSDFQWEMKDGHYFLKNTVVVKELLQFYFSRAINDSIDVIIFPELSIPEPLVEFIRIWSKENVKSVIAGSHYYAAEGKYYSRCPIILNGEIHFSEKIYPAPVELSPIPGETLSPGNEFLVLKNTSLGNFAVLICSDFLNDKLVSALLEMELDFLCVCAFQKNSDIYFSRMNNYVDNSETGLYILYCNFFQKGSADGKSSLFGLIDPIYADKLKSNGYTDLNPRNKLFEINNDAIYFSCTINLKSKRPFRNRTPTTRPNFTIISAGDKLVENNIHFAKKIFHQDEKYIQIDKLFVKPNEYEAINQILNHKKIVFIIGDPGIGKTYTAIKLLKEFYLQGYDPIWYAGLEKDERSIQRETLEEFIPEEKKVYYFEDPFGRSVFERRDILYQVFGPLIDRIRHIDSRVIISSRKEIFESFVEESLSAGDLEHILAELNVTKPSYSKTSLLKILRQLAADRCIWYETLTLRRLVQKSILDEHLLTPLAIRDFVFASENYVKENELQELIENRQKESMRVFAKEILDLSPSSKTLLVTVLLAGYKGTAYISKLYMSVLTTLRNSNSSLSIDTFSETLRRQNGYRIEQLDTSFHSGFAFTHSVYEEALVLAYMHNDEVKSIFKNAILSYCQEYQDGAFRTISAMIPTHINIAFDLFEILFTNAYIIHDNILRITIANKIINAYLELKHKKLVTIINRFLGIKDLFALIEASEDVNVITDALRLLIKIIKKNIFGAISVGEINWSRIIQSIHDHPRNYQQILEFVNTTVLITEKAIEEYDKIMKFKGIIFLLILQKNKEREKFVNRLSNSIYKKQIQALSDVLKSYDDLPGSKRNMAGLKSIVQTESLYSGEILVDRLVENSIKANNNLFAIGILGVTGNFEAGEFVKLKSANGDVFGFGCSNYSSSELVKIAGAHSSEIKDRLGYCDTIAAISKENISIFVLVKTLPNKKN